MEMYNATVDVAKKSRELTEKQIDQLIEKLASYHGAVAGSPRGWASATISLPAEDLTQACTTAIAVVTSAYDAPAIDCRVMTEKEFEATNGWDHMPDLVSVSEAAGLLGVSRQAVLQRISSGSLPAEKVGREYVIPRTAVTPAS